MFAFGLNTHTFFDTVRTVLERNSTLLIDNGDTRMDNARRLISKIVNALTATQETGGPAACAYLLGHPDHYTDRMFKTFYWRTYFYRAVDTGFPADKRFISEPDVGEKVVVAKKAGSIIPASRVNDYCFRPVRFAKWSLYDYLKKTDVCPLRAKHKLDEPFLTDTDHVSNSSSGDENSECEEDVVEPDSKDIYRFTSGHPSANTHGVVLLRGNNQYVLNFLGGTLPRQECGDREEYCMTMMMLFAPQGWRTGKDLKEMDVTWHHAFSNTNFAPEHMEVMKNMNVLYECHDAGMISHHNDELMSYAWRCQRA
ncbi:hypothetical protein A0H81_02177 [Grifola frondosa]|uniref:Uncharacterized protein n=1 Tax=Grifola frondosa TaxID=5627 RepID=A0A1C7MMW2_GRIFR|nr:hypothetical protein A0H81_02177 [Grifola frondosa]